MYLPVCLYPYHQPMCICIHAVYMHVFPLCLIAMLLPEYGESGAPNFSFQCMCHQMLTRDNSEDKSKRCNYRMENNGSMFYSV